MAAPTYAHDLTTIATGETTTNYGALGGGGAGLSASPDLSTQGNNCIDKQISNANKGIVYDNGSAIALGADDHVFTRMLVGTPGLVDTLSNQGAVVVAGNTNTNYIVFHVEGNETYGAVSRTGKCYVFRYVTTTSGTAPYRTAFGSPSGNPRYFGAKLNTTASVKGANLGLDVMRYGTGFYLIDGDAATPGTFQGAAAISDALANRLGILTWLGGTNYELQGRFVVGQTSAGVPAPAYFKVNSANISVIDTPHSLTDFTQFVIDHAGTVFDLTNVTVSGLGSNNPGKLVFNNASTTGLMTGCAWNDFGTSVLNSGVTCVNTSWRGSDQVTQAGATLTNVTVNESTGTTAIVIDTLSNVNGLTVTGSTGTGIDLTAETSTNITLDNIIATGNGTDVVVNNAADVTINEGAGSSIGTASNAGAGNVTIVQALIGITFTGLPPGHEFRIYDDDLDGLIGTIGTDREGIESLASSSYSITHLASEAGNKIYAQLIAPGVYVEEVKEITLGLAAQTINFTLQNEENV